MDSRVAQRLPDCPALPPTLGEVVSRGTPGMFRASPEF